MKKLTCTSKIACLGSATAAYETSALLQDDESGIYAQPDVSGGTIPESPQLYSEIEWREEFLGDVVYDKPPMILVG